MRVKVAIALIVVVLLAVLAGCGKSNEPLTDADRTGQQLAQDYKAELKDVDLKIDKVDIVVSENSKDNHSLVIAYVTKAGDDRGVFENEVKELLAPAVSHDYQLNDIIMVATDDKGVVVKSVSIDPGDFTDWSQDKLQWDEFVSRWIVTGF